MEKQQGVIEIQESIRHILFYDWDPIGVNDLAPIDEYDSYIGEIYRLLAAGASQAEIVQHLSHIEIVYVGSVTNLEHRKKVAEKLIKLNIKV